MSYDIYDNIKNKNKSLTYFNKEKKLIISDGYYDTAWYHIRFFPIQKLISGEFVIIDRESPLFEYSTNYRDYKIIFDTIGNDLPFKKVQLINSSFEIIDETEITDNKQDIFLSFKKETPLFLSYTNIICIVYYLKDNYEDYLDINFKIRCCKTEFLDDFYKNIIMSTKFELKNNITMQGGKLIKNDLNTLDEVKINKLFSHKSSFLKGEVEEVYFYYKNSTKLTFLYKSFDLYIFNSNVDRNIKLGKLQCFIMPLEKEIIDDELDKSLIICKDIKITHRFNKYQFIFTIKSKNDLLHKITCKILNKEKIITKDI